MAKENLWGPIEPVPSMRTPTNVLKEQASALSQMTKGVLRGKVHVGNRGGTFLIDLSIIAPAINNYEFDVAHVEHELALYPVTVVAAWERYEQGKTVTCQNEEEFTTALTTILQSELVRRAIASLLAQSNAM